MTLLIDTNVVLDNLLRREPFFADSYRVLRQVAESDTPCFLTASAATDVFYILRRNLPSAEEARTILAGLSQLVAFADVLASDIHEALMSELSDFEDAVVDAVAARIEADYIVTRNLRDFHGSQVKAIAPSELTIE